MGLSRGAVTLLVREAARRPLAGSVCTLGRQHVYVTAAELAHVARRHNVPLAAKPLELHRERDLAARGFISDGCLLKSLGLTEIVRLDCSDYEAPDEIFDLNEPATPSHLVGRFDLVLDSGTLEHVFDVPAVLRHCLRMVKPGGRIIHLTPSSNCVDHGLYSVSPTLYADFYSAAGCRVEEILLCRLPLAVERGWWRIYEYPLDRRPDIPLGRLDGAIWFTWAVVTATGESKPPAAVQQSSYVATWRERAGDSGSDWAEREPPHTRAGRLLRAVAGRPVLTALARAAISGWRRLLVRYRQHVRGRVPLRYLGRV
jgi:SAM-dependent methyltransferase